MSRIKRLDTVIANKIAAGEVIEKIGNVVKELVENSIDAEATKIDIELLESGLKSITVIDNGIGMDETDALLAFERHATSKIFKINDLFRINSLGFRGEALPSIASISNVKLVTSDGSSSISVEYEDGKFISKNTVPGNIGTKITVTKLFYTTPARFKYLKSPQYELAVITSMINKFALAYPEISFRLTNDQKLIFVSNGSNNIVDIIANIYSKEVAKKMISFSNESRDYKISGYTTNPIINRSNRNYINIFVNKRHIIDTKIVRAINECYEQLIPKNRYPIAVIYIECDPSIIDVNIHPRKQEIKFSEYNKLLELIKMSIEEKVQKASIYQTPKSDSFKQEKMIFSEEPKETYQPKHEDVKEIKISKLEEEPKQIIPDIYYIGQYTGTYLIYQNENGLFLLDQHAAAERIRYERYIERMATNQISQNLLVPLKLVLSNDLMIQLNDYLDQLNEFGIKSEMIDNELIINQIPNWFPKGYELVYTEEVVMKLVNEKTLTNKIIIDDLAKLLACKHSLKANHYITESEADQLVKDLRTCIRPYTCPHGRPIIVNISIEQIERLFNRVM
ncbi:DNA mismatch repair endonuclease MutL [Candidatus Izemoplasma sp. B36]|uniref:DNA mismatch repair endonuclease MutL n=1 Tax=Candidatus Izemoplasma sp. B36 TaxID=3242468 RepID=UPI0035590FAA